MIPVLRLLSILILVAGSVVMAPARGVMAAASLVEICSEAGAVTVVLDAQGNPAGPHHLCPDCIACHSTGFPALAAALRFAVTVLPLSFPSPRAAAAAVTPLIHPVARAPPLSI